MRGIDSCFSIFNPIYITIAFIYSNLAFHYRSTQPALIWQGNSRRSASAVISHSGTSWLFSRRAEGGGGVGGGLSSRVNSDLMQEGECKAKGSPWILPTGFSVKRNSDKRANGASASHFRGPHTLFGFFLSLSVNLLLFWGVRYVAWSFSIEACRMFAEQVFRKNASSIPPPYVSPSAIKMTAFRFYGDAIKGNGSINVYSWANTTVWRQKKKSKWCSEGRLGSVESGSGSTANAPRES